MALISIFSHLCIIAASVTIPVTLSGCGKNATWNSMLPASSQLSLSSRTQSQSQRGLRMVRASIHLHSPISYDACTSMDRAKCFSDLRSALCKNRLDFVALTDHPNHMSENEFPQLLLQSDGDTPVIENGNTVANQIHCEDGHTVTVTAGFESQLMTLSMKQHLDPNISTRSELYTSQSPELVTRLKNETDAIVIMPHTETAAKTDDKLAELNLDGIEIYNLHANINPKIRKADLGLTYFQGLIDLLVYWIDPFGEQQPDLAFLSFMHVSEIYSKKWAALYARGHKLVGFAGNDAHQSFIPGTARDGDKVDSYRRLTRWVTHHFLAEDMSLSKIKSALKAGRGSVVFEGFGSPVGFDFYGESGGSTFEMGASISQSSQAITLHAHVPSLHDQSPQSDKSPVISLRLIRVAKDASETVVASATDSVLDYPVKESGAYRVEVTIQPLHLKKFVGYQKELTEKEYQWIISNPIYVESSTP